MQIGDKGRFHVGSDCYPVTLVAMSASGKTVQFRQDSFRAAPGHDYFGEQKWECYDNPNGAVKTARWNKKRERFMVDGCSVFFDGWHARQDPSF